MKTRPGLVVLLLVTYMAWYITTPYNSPRLGFLATMNFERWLAGATLLVVLARGPATRIGLGVPVLVIGLCLFMYVSYLASSHMSNARCQEWADDYWKRVAFFVLLALGLRTIEALAAFLRGTFYVSIGYQLLSWRDFLAGGSYVYQQGLRRICGAWSGGGLGSANGFASLAVCTLPLAVLLFRTARNRRVKGLASAGAALSLLTIVYSGTRGALITALVFGLALAGRRVIRYAVPGALALWVLVATLPPEYTSRYLSLISSPSDDEEMSREAQVAEGSAQGRLEGFIDGLKLGNLYPVLGCGPEASPMARSEVREGQEVLALHNLYGQVVGELGWGGAALWAALILAVTAGSVRVRGAAEGLAPEDRGLVLAIRAWLLQSVLVLMVYGACAHNLYDIRWLVVFGCQVALVARAADRLHEWPGGTPGPDRAPDLGCAGPWESPESARGG